MAPNTYIVIDRGASPESPVSYIGPFPTEPAAVEHKEAHVKEKPTDAVSVDVLIDPSNC